MAQVLVRNLDDQVVRTLKTRAELRGCSLEQELRRILTEAARLTPEEKVALIRRAQAMTPPGVPQTDSAELIREDRGGR